MEGGRGRISEIPINLLAEIIYLRMRLPRGTSPRNQAKAEGKARYFGGLCAKHPELLGERYVAGYGCVRCTVDAALKHAQTPHGKARIKAYVSEPARAAANNERSKAWQRSPAGQAALAAYRQSDKERARIAAKNASEAHKLRSAALRKRPDQIAKRAVRQRVFEQHLSKHATPAWANLWMIAEAYDLAKLRTKLTGVKHNVDHCVPLISSIVCGLHVEHNLQVIPAVLNRAKSNRLLPEFAR
jgi:hypothetical protein